MKTLLLILLLFPCALIAQEAADSTEVEIIIAPTADDDKEKEEPIFMIVEKMPQFPGGQLAFRKYIALNVQYPEEAREGLIEGKVYVRFCITSDGSIDKISIARGIDPLLDKEAIRVIKTSPKWQPGEQRGKKVSVWYTMPIVFKLD